MNYYAHVHFNRNEHDKQRKFLQLMNSTEIIKLSKEEIDNIYNEDILTNAPGADNHLVLHGEEEKKRFGYAMGAFFPEKDYEITEAPGSPEFEDWLKKKGALKTSP